jgi:hypothetical protein
MTRLRLAARIAFLSGALVLPGCDRPPPTGQAQADAATRAACQERAEQADRQQNRAEIYSPPPTVNTPFSSNFTPVTDRGLSDLFVHDRMISDCIRNTGTGAERTPPSLPGR